MLITDLAQLGDLVRRRRAALNISQTELAERVGATRQWVSRLENGKHDISTARLFAVLDALELNLDIRPPGSPTAITLPVPNMQSLVPSAALEAIRAIQVSLPPQNPFMGLAGVGGSYSPVIPESLQQTLRALSSHRGEQTGAVDE